MSLFYLELLKYSGIILLTLILSECLTRKLNLKARPSKIIRCLSDNSIKFFTEVGKWVAKISSFYALIEFGLIKQAIIDIFEPMIELLSSPFYTVKGYISQMFTYQHPQLIVVGTATLATLILYYYLHGLTGALFVSDKLYHVKNLIGL